MKKYGMWIGAGIGVVIGAVGFYLYGKFTEAK